MKKLIYSFVAFMLLSVSLVSCLKDGNNYAECTQLYVGIADSVYLKDTQHDSVFIDSIIKACDKLQLTNVTFQKKVHIDGTPYVIVARDSCDKLADVEYKKTLNGKKRSDFEKKLASMLPKDHTLDELDDFTVVYGLHEYFSGNVVRWYHREYNK